MAASAFNCGNCGAMLPRRFAHSRMIVCESCGSSSVLRDGAFEVAGTGGVMQEAPSLVELGHEVRIGSMHLLPLGHARFSYGRGWWDEYWCRDGAHEEGCWLSVDEGDLAVEWPLERSKWPAQQTLMLRQSVLVGDVTFLVTEAESARCEAVRGEFPEDLTVGETHLYYDLTGPKGELASYEVWEGGRGWTTGWWIDPWDVRVA